MIGALRSPNEQQLITWTPHACRDTLAWIDHAMTIFMCSPAAALCCDIGHRISGTVSDEASRNDVRVGEPIRREPIVTRYWLAENQIASARGRPAGHYPLGR